MKLARCSPFSTSALTPLDAFLSQPFGRFPSVDDLLKWTTFPAVGSPAQLAADVYEDENHYYARFEAPGVQKEDAKVELNDRLLTVSVSRNVKKGDAESVVKWSRSVSVPEGIEVEGISAKLEDGLLTVTLPKQEQRKPRRIELN